MTVDDISKRIYGRYNWDGKKELGEDIKEMLSRYKPDDLTRIWERFNTTYQGMAAPKPAHFFAIATDLGLTGKAAKGKYQGAYECVCGVKYSMESSNCPICKSPEQKQIVDAAGHDIIACQYDCYHCDVYADSNEFGRFGPSCKSFSLGTPIPNCDRCRCRDCCLYEHNFREDEKHNTFFTEGRAMPWIGAAGAGITQRVNFESLMDAVKAKAIKHREGAKDTIGYKRGYKMTWETKEENKIRKDAIAARF